MQILIILCCVWVVRFPYSRIVNKWSTFHPFTIYWSLWDTIAGWAPVDLYFVSAFFVTVRAGTAYRKIWRLVNNFCSHNKVDCSEIAIVLSNLLYHYFYSASALLAMQSAVLARGILSVCLSVRPSVRHGPVLCPDEWRYDRAVFSIW